MTNGFPLREIALPPLTEDGERSFETSGRSALAALLSGVYQGLGVFFLTGRPGIGKTTLLRRLHRQLAGLEGVALLSTSGPLTCRQAMTLPQILAACEPCLGLGGGIADSLKLARRLQQLGDEGCVPVLLADDADLLDDGALEALVTLGSLQSGQRRLLSVVLAGSPELPRRPPVPPGDDAVSAEDRVVTLAPLAEAEAARLLRRRLGPAAGKAGPVATEATQGRSTPDDPTPAAPHPGMAMPPHGPTAAKPPTRLTPVRRKGAGPRAKLAIAGGIGFALLLAIGSALFTDGAPQPRRSTVAGTVAGTGTDSPPPAVAGPAAPTAALAPPPLAPAPEPAARGNPVADPAGTVAAPIWETEPDAWAPSAGGPPEDTWSAPSPMPSTRASTAPSTEAAARSPAAPAAGAPARPPAAPSAGRPRTTEAKPRAPAAPASAAPATAVPSRQRQIETLLTEGDGLLQSGDIDGARASYQGAFERGSGEGARRLAQTFDPRSNAAPAAPPSAQEAILWYQDAARRGDRRARADLTELESWLESSAASGDREARRVLDAWRQPAEPDAEPTP